MTARVTDRATHLRALAVLAAGGRFGNDQHARSLDQLAEASERGDRLPASYHWLHVSTLVAALRYALSSSRLAADYLRTLWIALAHDDRAELRAELEPLARAFVAATSRHERASARRALAAWAETRESRICRAFSAPFREET